MLMSKITKFAQNLLLFIAASAISLAALEMAVRLIFPQYDPSGGIRFYTESDGTVIGLPNSVAHQVKNTGDYDVTVRFNSDGYRDPKNVRSSIHGAIFVVGDSFSMGWGVEERERFSDRLSQSLGQDVYNIAIPADLDTYDKLTRRAERLGAKIDLLIVGVCMENDLRIYEPSVATSRPVDTGVPITSSGVVPIPPAESFASYIQQWKLWLMDRSSTYFLVTSVVHRTPWLAALAARLGLLKENLKAVDDQPIPTPAVLKSSEERLIRLLNGHKAIVLIIPSRQLWVGTEQAKSASAVAHEAFVSALRSRGVRVVDLRGKFEMSGNPLGYHFRHDGHWNAAGHALAAHELANAIRHQ